MVKGLPPLKVYLKLSIDCMVGNITSRIHPKEKACGELIKDSNSCMLTSAVLSHLNPTIKKRYIITFIDDYSRKEWTYFFNAKSKVFVMFKKFKSLVKKETRNFICCLRIDRGWEFTLLEFNKFCAQMALVGNSLQPATYTLQ